jgi:hypothetical protein
MDLDFLENYLMQSDLEKGVTVEDTINTILESLIKDPKNSSDVKYRSELIEACSVILNGLPRIKDPLRLYKNLALAFERRGFCIYKDTVKNSFSRLIKEIVKQNKVVEFETFYFKLDNVNTKKILIPQLPKSFLLKILQTQKDSLILSNATYFLASHPDFSKKSVFDLILSSKQELVLSAIAAINNRSDFSYEELRDAIPEAPTQFIKDALINLIYSNPKYTSKKEFMRFCVSNQFSYGNLLCVESRPDLEVKDFIILSEYSIPAVRTFATQKLLKRTGDKIIGSAESKTHSLKYISGKRGQRKRKMVKLTRNLRA